MKILILLIASLIVLFFFCGCIIAGNEDDRGEEIFWEWQKNHENS